MLEDQNRLEQNALGHTHKRTHHNGGREGGGEGEEKLHTVKFISSLCYVCCKDLVGKSDRPQTSALGSHFPDTGRMGTEWGIDSHVTFCPYFLGKSKSQDVYNFKQGNKMQI